MVQWAYESDDADVAEKNLHIENTRDGPNGSITFYLYGPRPRGMTVMEWDAVRQKRWERIFGTKESV